MNLIKTLAAVLLAMMSGNAISQTDDAAEVFSQYIQEFEKNNHEHLKCQDIHEENEIPDRIQGFVGDVLVILAI